MSDKIDITDPYKVDPSLKDKSEAQIQHEIKLREMALEHLRYEARKKEVSELTATINRLNGVMVKAAKELYKHGFLNAKLQEAYTGRNGVFAVHLLHKDVTEDQVLGRIAQSEADATPKQKRTRKPKA